MIRPDNLHHTDTPAPDPHRARKKAALLVSLSRGSSRTRACEAAGLSRRTFYNWLNAHPDFRDRVEEAELKPVAACEAVLLRCALKAEEDPRYLRALFHFLKHRGGWGEHPRQEPEPQPLVQGFAAPEPDPDALLTATLRAEMEAEEETHWGLALVLSEEPEPTPSDPDTRRGTPPVCPHEPETPTPPEHTGDSVPSVPLVPLTPTPFNTGACPAPRGHSSLHTPPVPSVPDPYPTPTDRELAVRAAMTPEELAAWRIPTWATPDHPQHTGDGAPSVPPVPSSATALSPINTGACPAPRGHSTLHLCPPTDSR